VGTNVAVIRVGMSFPAADTLLKSHGAKTTDFQVMLTPEQTRVGQRLHYYRLPTGPVLSMITKPTKGGRAVLSLAVSTYASKREWESKIDPERDRFFNSFNTVEAYDLEEPPNHTSEGIRRPADGPPRPPR